MEEEDVTTPQPSTSTSPESSRDSSATPMSIYSAILPEHLNEIKSIDLAESFSTKIDFIARHIIWLRSFEPGAKTVVFSQYQSFCPGHLANAFKRLKIRFASLGDKRGVDRFKHDPTVECLLMHAGSQASGMNLVNATHVLLCEPLVSIPKRRMDDLLTFVGQHCSRASSDRPCPSHWSTPTNHSMDVPD